LPGSIPAAPIAAFTAASKVLLEMMPFENSEASSEKVLSSAFCLIY